MTIDLSKIQAGPIVDRACYLDPEIFDLEAKRIFDRTWLFVAHESEFKQPGDFRTAEIAGQPVIAVMGTDRQIRVLFNSCRHRGATIAEDAEGTVERFRCPYHHWTYDLEGRLIDVPRPEGFGAGFRLEDHGIRPVPRVDRFHGCVFACLEAGAPSLAEYLDTVSPYLEYVLTYGGKDQVAIGYYSYTYNANWKLLWENTMDDYHAEYLHGGAFAQRAALFKMTGTKGIQEVEGSRHPHQLGIHGALDQIDDDRTLTIQKHRPRRIYVGIFPALLALYHPLWDVTGLRIIQPIAVDKTRILTYCLGPADASEAERKALGERFHYSWGPGGRAGVDDIVVLERVQHGMKARRGGDILITRGIDHETEDGEPADDHSVRGLWHGWRQYMLGEEA